MKYKIGDTVTRISHNHDIAFTIIDIKNDICYLKGLNTRLLADSPLSDLKLCNLAEDIEEEEKFNERIKLNINFRKAYTIILFFSDIAVE